MLSDVMYPFPSVLEMDHFLHNFVYKEWIAIK